MLSKNYDIGYINKINNRIRNLAYTVNPLPLSLINYIFDFGNLKEDEEKKYIDSFVTSLLLNQINKDKNNKETEINEGLYKIISESIYVCQTFIREKSEISSISLREIERFKKFFDFFVNFILIVDKSTKNKETKIKNKYLKAINLSLYICYYLRIIDHTIRKELSEKLSKILNLEFLEYPHEIENEIINNINVGIGIAKNRALLDNIFALFSCINAKIPIFICGKAGCSKTLSFSLLFQSMKGEHSNNELFKEFPKIFLNSYQGSLTSNSSEIQNIFKRAKKISDWSKKQESKVISLILFDEMGLAEISKNNPLKVIHSELDENDDEISFVGISNWALDASKMNRGVHLSIQEPDLEDLLLTSETISRGIFEEIQNFESYEQLIKNLTKSYYDYKYRLYQKYNSSYDFHGSRDFYYLIKITANMLKANNNKELVEKIAMESIERNFGGLELGKEEINKKWSSIKLFKKIFSEYQNNNIDNIEKYDIFSCIKKNIKEENNRYLLLITDGTKNDSLIEFILRKIKLKYRFIQGSKLKEDQNENYVLQKAWSIISSMKEGDLIILKDMEIVYPKFYDLFNKNFQKYGNSFYARIVLDSTTSERLIVHNNFRCIILLEKKNIDNQDPPFLNRFEKHLISFQYLLNEKQNLLANEIYEEIKELTTIHEDKGYGTLLININIEEIRCLILELSMREGGLEQNIDKITDYIIPIFSQENILASMYSQGKKYIKKDKIKKIYEENSHTNFFKFLENVKRNKIIIYTFSPNYKDLFNNSDEIGKIENCEFGTFCNNNTIEITFNEKFSENMINYFFKLYYEKENNNLFIVHFSLKDIMHLKYIKFQLDDFHKKKEENKKKIFLFIIHIDKNHSLDYFFEYNSFFFSLFSEYQQITIDNLFNLLEKKNISVLNFYDKTNEELIKNQLFNFNVIFKKEFDRAIMKYFKDKKDLDNLSHNKIQESIIKKIQNTLKNSDNLLRKFLIDYSKLEKKDYDFISYFKENVEDLISDYLKKIIIELNNSGFLVTEIFEKKISEKFEYVFNFIENINLIEHNFIDKDDYYLIDLEVPGSKLLFNQLFNSIKDCRHDYINKEDEYRKNIKNRNEINSKSLEEFHFEKKQYLKKILWNEVLLTENIFKEYRVKIIKDLIHLLFYNKNKSMSENEEKFLLFLYKEKNVNENPLDKFFDFFLWAGSYQTTIFIFLEIIQILDKFYKKENLIGVLIEKYNLIQYVKENQKDEKKQKVNGLFYRISEAICEFIIDVNLIDYKKIKNLKELYRDLNKICQIFSQFNSTLYLSIKKIYSIIPIVSLINYYIKNPGNNKDVNNINEFIKNINDENNFLLKKDINNAKESLKHQINIAIELSHELSMEIFNNKYLQYNKQENYSLELIKVLFEYSDLIKYSSLFFNYIFLMYPIKPRKLKESMNEDEKRDYLNSFGEIKNMSIGHLKEINKELEKNEVLKEILMYIFELRIISYFQDCEKMKFIQRNYINLLTGINFEYYQNSLNPFIFGNRNLGEFENIRMIFYFSFIRCYLYYFVDFRIKYKNIGDITIFHEDLYNISNSNAGKLVSLYIYKIFLYIKKIKEEDLDNYLKNDRYDWITKIRQKNNKFQFFTIDNYENSNHLLFDIYAEINKEKQLKQTKC